MSDLDPSRICVVSGRYPESPFRAFENHRVYCDRHGYTYAYCGWPTRAKNPYFNKLEYLKEYAPHFDYLFWIDDDAFFMDHERGLEWLLPQADQFLSICRSPDNKKIHTFISSGQFALRCDATGQGFLNAVCQTDLELVRTWWKDDLGYFSNGDQDAMVYLLHEDKRFSNGFERHHHSRFNSRLAELKTQEDVFILHFTGRPEVKAADYKTAQKHLATGPSLLTTEQQAGYRIIVPPALRPWYRRTARRVVRKLQGKS